MTVKVHTLGIMLVLATDLVQKKINFRINAFPQNEEYEFVVGIAFKKQLEESFNRLVHP